MWGQSYRHPLMQLGPLSEIFSIPCSVFLHTDRITVEDFLKQYCAGV